MGRPKLVTDEFVLNAARRVFQEKGHAATTRDVARAAGISQAVLYQRFATKDELFLAAMAPDRIDPAWLLGEGVPATREEAKADIRAIGQRLIAHLEQVGPALLHLSTHPAFRPEIMQQGHDDLGAADVVAGLALHLDDVGKRGLLRRGLMPHAAADALITLAHGAVLQGLLTGAGDQTSATTRFDALFEILWAGFEPTPE